MITGKGMFMWEFDHCSGGSPGAMVKQAKAAGLSYVLVKVQDGINHYHPSTAHRVIAAFKAGGIDVIPWFYSRAVNVTREAVMLGDTCEMYGFTRLVIDAEVEYTHGGGAVKANQLVDALRIHCQKVSLGLSSYYLPNYHPDFPWTDFDVDFVMPQVYWYKRDPQWCLRSAFEQNNTDRFRNMYQVVPTAGVYQEAMESVDHLRKFLDACKIERAQSVNFWSWQHASPEVWTEIAKFVPG